jgi:hypothetical protein
MLLPLLAAALSVYPVTKLEVSVRTGNDDLRDGSDAYLLYSLGGAPLEAKLTNGGRWADRTWATAEVRVDPAVEDSLVKIRGIRFVAGKKPGMSDDQWELNGLQISAIDRSRTNRGIYRNVEVRHKFTQSGVWRIAEESPIDTGRPNSGEPQYAELELFTGGDDLRANSAAHVTLILDKGYAVSEYLRGPIAANASKKQRVRVTWPDAYKLHRVEVMMVEEGRSATDNVDNWDLYGIRVDMPGTENDYENRTRLARMTAGEVFRTPIISSFGDEVNPRVNGLYVTILTGEDDLKQGSTAVIQIAGPRGNYTKQITNLKARSRSYHYIPCTGVLASDIRQITIIPVQMPHDGWTLKGLAVNAAVGYGPTLRLFEDWEINQRIEGGSRYRSASFRTR